MQKIIFVFLLFLHALSGFCQSETDVPQKENLFGHSLPLIVGHRGGFDSKLPENSISRFDFAYEIACSKPIGIEFDIRESASGSLYLMHDSTVDRTTNGNGKISLLTDSYISTLFLKDGNGNPTTEKIPLFSDVLKHFQDKNIMLMLDVKGKIYPEVIRMVEEMKMESKCILLTFNRENTRLVKEAIDKILISALVINKENWESLLKLQIPSRQLIAYVNKETPLLMINEICQSKIIVMTDMSENIYNNSQPFYPEYYRRYLTEMKLGIIITDYPVSVNKLFCKQ
jgi:glycerophosphoryl diester phosphodiesterase